MNNIIQSKLDQLKTLIVLGLTMVALGLRPFRTPSIRRRTAAIPGFTTA